MKFIKLCATFAICILIFCSMQIYAFEFNVASFNIRQAQTENSNAWQVRKNSVRNLIDFHKIDICGVQEAFIQQLEFLSNSTYSYVGVGRDDGKNAGEHSAILFNRKKFKLLKTGDFWFSQTPEKPSLGWGARYKRICTWAEFKPSKGNATFFVFNAHLDHESLASQEKSVLLLLEKVKSIAGSKPCIILGDFNMTIDDSKMTPLASSLTAAVNFPNFYGTNFSYHDYMKINLAKIPKDISQHIDHIFLTKHFEILCACTLTDLIAPLPQGMKNYCDNVSEGENRVGYPSDHFPVFAHIRLFL